MVVTRSCPAGLRYIVERKLFLYGLPCRFWMPRWLRPTKIWMGWLPNRLVGPEKGREQFLFEALPGVK